MKWKLKFRVSIHHTSIERLFVLPVLEFFCKIPSVLPLQLCSFILLQFQYLIFQHSLLHLSVFSVHGTMIEGYCIIQYCYYQQQFFSTSKFGYQPSYLNDKFMRELRCFLHEFSATKLRAIHLHLITCQNSWLGSTYECM